MRIGITGHQSLPNSAAQYVVDQLDQLIPWTPGRAEDVGISSLAAGADQLFAEHILRVGARLFVVVPSSRYGETFNDTHHLKTYRQLLLRASGVERLGFPSPSEEAFLAAGSRIVELCDWLVAVWDGEASRGLGGTADVVAAARHLGKRVEVVWPAGVRR